MTFTAFQRKTINKQCKQNNIVVCFVFFGVCTGFFNIGCCILGVPDQVQSCQRQFPTNVCPTPFLALKTVLGFAYARWNASNPENRYDMCLGLALLR